MSEEDFSHIKSEVSKALKNDPKLVEELAKVVAEELKRFAGREATEADAITAAKKLAGYFGLEDTFEEIVLRKFKGHLVSVTTYHRMVDASKYFEIEQSAKSVRIRAERSYVRRNIV